MGNALNNYKQNGKHINKSKKDNTYVLLYILGESS